MEVSQTSVGIWEHPQNSNHDTAAATEEGGAGTGLLYREGLSVKGSREADSRRWYCSSATAEKAIHFFRGIFVEVAAGRVAGEAVLSGKGGSGSQGHELQLW